VLAIALPPAVDTLPTISLGEAIERAARLDPAYVSALGQADNAAWTRRAARLAFIVPSLEIGVDASKYSSPFVNPGTGQPGTSAVTTHVTAGYELLSVRKIAAPAATAGGDEAGGAGAWARPGGGPRSRSTRCRRPGCRSRSRRACAWRCTRGRSSASRAPTSAPPRRCSPGPAGRISPS